MLPETLVALACALANPGPFDLSPIEAQLTAPEKKQVQAIIESGACLPDAMEKLLQDTHDRVRKGEIIIEASHDPTWGGG